VPAVTTPPFKIQPAAARYCGPGQRFIQPVTPTLGEAATPATRHHTAGADRQRPGIWSPTEWRLSPPIADDAPNNVDALLLTSDPTASCCSAPNEFDDGPITIWRCCVSVRLHRSKIRPRPLSGHRRSRRKPELVRLPADGDVFAIDDVQKTVVFTQPSAPPVGGGVAGRDVRQRAGQGKSYRHWRVCRSAAGELPNNALPSSENLARQDPGAPDTTFSFACAGNRARAPMPERSEPSPRAHPPVIVVFDPRVLPPVRQRSARC